MKRTQAYSCILMVSDVLLLPSLFFVRWLSGVMLTHPRPCIWSKFGGQCVTCGGTHFVHALLHGEFTEAFFHNPFLFAGTIFLIVSFIILHFYVFGKKQFAKRVLSALYSIPSLIVFCVGMMLFLLWRNWPVVLNICQQLS